MNYFQTSLKATTINIKKNKNYHTNTHTHTQWKYIWKTSINNMIIFYYCFRLHELYIHL